MGPLGFNEILIILVIVLLLFGGKKIPELMRGLGRGVREFNDAKNTVKREIEEGITDKDRTSGTITTATTTPSQSLILFTNDGSTAIVLFYFHRTISVRIT
jgi:sec-independent protein translocase protein TatA